MTAPELWDKRNETIVNNESAEIIRLFNSAFDELTGDNQDFYPQELREEIDRINQRVYDEPNNGVYKSGFATTQKAYEKPCRTLFDALDWVEGLLGERRYLAGEHRSPKRIGGYLPRRCASIRSITATSNAMSGV